MNMFLALSWIGGGRFFTLLSFLPLLYFFKNKCIKNKKCIRIRISVSKIKTPGFSWIFVSCTEYFYEKSKPSHHLNTIKILIAVSRRRNDLSLDYISRQNFWEYNGLFSCRLNVGLENTESHALQIYNLTFRIT